MPPLLVSIERFLQTPAGPVDITSCPFYPEDAVCSACHAKAEALRHPVKVQDKPAPSAGRNALAAP